MVFKNKRAQIWIETVIYTLVAFVMIGAVLAFVKPKIQEMQDQAIIEQTIEVMEEINSVIMDVKKVSGNQRVLNLGIKKGVLNIDAGNDKIFFEIESRHQYSEIGQGIEHGSMILLTEPAGSENYKVSLEIDYSNYDLKLEDGSNLKQLSKSSAMYKISVSNEGRAEEGEKTEIVFDVS